MPYPCWYHARYVARCLATVDFRSEFLMVQVLGAKRMLHDVVVASAEVAETEKRVETWVKNLRSGNRNLARIRKAPLHEFSHLPPAPSSSALRAGHDLCGDDVRPDVRLRGRASRWIAGRSWQFAATRIGPCNRPPLLLPPHLQRPLQLLQHHPLIRPPAEDRLDEVRRQQREAQDSADASPRGRPGRGSLDDHG